MPTDLDWPSWTRALAEAVRKLDDGASLLVTATGSAARPTLLRKARLGGFVPARHQVVAPWVRLVRSDEHLRGSCVGSEAAGGRFPFSPAERSALADLGWHEPPPLEGEDYTHWWPDDVPSGPFLPEDDARRAAQMVAETFRTVLSPPTADDPAPALPTITTD
ncbi:hypothetical protein [Oryzobacter terrae]|uniref:TY-Chap domain-containing protein n=1 Tax=Oryzobacter terrae TaxID=1620385 RepID=UPI00366A696A